MSKPILIAFLVILLAGSGVVFANTELPGDLAGFYSQFVEVEPAEEEPVVETKGEEPEGEEPEGEEPEGEEPEGEEPEGKEPEGEEPGDNKSDVAKAVHDALTGEDNDLKPGDEGFGQAVADRAKDPDVHLGQEVSGAARNANGSAGTGSNGSPGNSGSAGGGGSPGNSGNAGGGGKGR